MIGKRFLGVKSFFVSIAFTIVMLFVANGPMLEGLNPYSALAFLCGLLAGIMWGVFFFAWSLLDKF
jgi:hypothetical protein